MTEKSDNSESAISRWSRRKLDNQAVSDHQQVLLAEQEPESLPILASEQHVIDEAEPIWQQLNVDPETKRAALSSLFRQPEFNIVDRMNEYDEDFTSFESLGSIVTHEMKHMLKLAEQKTRPGEEQIEMNDLDDVLDADSAIESLAEVNKHENELHNDNEDKEIG